MKYQQPSFSVAMPGSKVTDEKWARIFGPKPIPEGAVEVHVAPDALPKIVSAIAFDADGNIDIVPIKEGPHELIVLSGKGHLIIDKEST